jgi:hypothetical protein
MFLAALADVKEWARAGPRERSVPNSRGAARVQPMPWTARFRTPVILKDGRLIATLGQARALMLNLPVRHQIRPHWQFAAELLLDAAEHHGNVEDAYQQMSRALTAEGLL